MKRLAFALCLLTLPLSARADDEQNNLARRFTAAWNASDPESLSALFAGDAVIVTPDGTSLRGRDAIRAFYKAVFARGYAGSTGGFAMAATRDISSDIAVIDAQWAIENIHGPDGKPRPTERGILTAVVIRKDGDWRILDLRENTGATQYTPFSPH
jgi:uncharacterized protein (TIGR02246 family)